MLATTMYLRSNVLSVLHYCAVYGFTMQSLLLSAVGAANGQT